MTKNGMLITILTLFPQMFEGPFSSSIISRAVKEHKITLSFVNIRDFAKDKYKTVDDRPYGGGVGMIMKVDVADRAITHAKSLFPEKKPYVILMDPQEKHYQQAEAQLLSEKEHLIFLCAHYEGIDQRVRQLADAEFSIGDYILTGGEIPAMVMVDSIVRLIPGVLAKTESAKNESFSDPNLLEGPQYTNPQVYNGMEVPRVLLSGNHKIIDQWKKEEARKTTILHRPDMVK